MRKIILKNLEDYVCFLRPHLPPEPSNASNWLLDLPEYSNRNDGVRFGVEIVIGNNVCVYEQKCKKLMISPYEQRIEVCPILRITDIDRFIYYANELNKFVKDKGRNFTWFNYDSDEFPVELRFLDRIWFNASDREFNNPEDYLQKILNMLRNDSLLEYSFDSQLGSLEKLGQFHISNSIQHWAYESPYSLDFGFIKEIDCKICGEIPSISFGIDGDTVYVYGVQMKHKSNEIKSCCKDCSLSNQIRRAAYKIDKDYQKIVYVNREIEVFRPGLISLAASMAIFHKFKTKQIVVQLVLPLRLQDHRNVDNRERNGNLENTTKVYLATSIRLKAMFLILNQLVGGLKVNDEGNYLRIEFDEKLTSDNTVIDEIINLEY